MEVFNKVLSQVTSSVSQTMSQLSAVLPGNPVTREFETITHIASGGPGLLWKIYKGIKRSTKQEASIFVLDKKQLEKYNKTDRELILETLRRGIVQLTKIRHPKVLTVQHPLEESRDSLAFATEPVFASLANLLGHTTNMPQPGNMSDYKFFDLEIKYGLLQISEGLAFLHNNMKLLHKNLNPESIIINTQGLWKIFGLEFCIHSTSPINSAPVFPFEEYSPTVPVICQPNLDYLAPECVLTKTHSTASDMFSLGMLSYTLNSRERIYIKLVKELQQFQMKVQDLKKLDSGKLNSIPDGLRENVKLLLSLTPSTRPDAHQFIKIPYFDDIGIKTLVYMDSILQMDSLQKSQFYKGLPKVLAKFPHRIKLQRILTGLSQDLGHPGMIPFILPSIFDIARDCSQNEYYTYVWPLIKPLMRRLEPVQILLIMLQNMELLLKLTPPVDIQQHVRPMLYYGLDSDSTQIHEICLTVLPKFASLLDHSDIKNTVLPKIKKLCLNTTALSVRVNCLLCIGRLLEYLDKWLVLDEVLPFLPQIPSREPAILMGILGIYKLCLNHKKIGLTKEIIATRVLPFLIPLCIENGLTSQQFNSLTSLVKEMFQIVENEHRAKLEQLNSIKDEQNTLTSAVSGGNLKAELAVGLENIMENKDFPSFFDKQSHLEPVLANTDSRKTQPTDLSSSLLDWMTLQENNIRPSGIDQVNNWNAFSKYNPTTSPLNLNNAKYDLNRNMQSFTQCYIPLQKNWNKPDLSAFNDLLSTPVGKSAKIPMNMMISNNSTTDHTSADFLNKNNVDLLS